MINAQALLDKTASRVAEVLVHGTRDAFFDDSGSWREEVSQRTRDEMLLHDQLVRRIHPANKDRVCFHAFGVGPVVAPQGGQGGYIVHHFDEHRAPSVRFVGSLEAL